MREIYLKALGADLSRLFIPPRPFSDATQEQHFLADYSQQNLHQRRLFVIIALVLWTAFSFWDYHHRVHHPSLISDNRFMLIIALRIIGAVFIAVGIGKAFSPLFLIERHASQVIMLTIIGIILCLAGMISTLPAPLNYQYYFVGIILVLFFQYGTLALLTWQSLLTTTFSIAVLVVQDWIHAPLDIYFFPSMFYLLAFASVGLAVSVKLERTARERFSQILALNANNQNLKDANRSMRREKKKTDAAFQEMFNNEFKKAQALSEKTEATARFVRATYHDTMQPLASIAALAYAGGQAAGRGAYAEIPDLFRDISTSGREINLLFKGLRDVFMIGESQPDICAASLNQLFDEIQQVHGPRAREKNLALRIVKRRHDVSLHTDPVLMIRILGNLVSNAIKYTDSGGVLIGSVSAKTVLRIDVIDTGIGIPDAFKQKIFDEFFQINNPSKDKTMGLGLGLYIVRTFIAKLPGHRLSFSSRQSRGTRFSIDCPIAESAQQASTSPIKVDPGNAEIDLAGAYLLIVDDDSRVLASLVNLLEPLNAIVRAVPGLEALVALLESAPDRNPELLITDYRLSGDITGVDVMKRLRTHFHWVCTPTLVYSAELAQNLIQDLEFTEFVSKSEEPALLIKKIQEMVVAGRLANDASLEESNTPNT
jgi:signal transduction histidine kinase/CheY-like chemotaxis protein